MSLSSTPPLGRRSRLLLGLAAAAIAFAAADTYVVVLALPDMMSSVGLDIDQLQRAAPIISGFLLGYIGILPLIGRISDLRGRVPVLVGSMLIFAMGSVITAAAYNLDTLVAGRFIQGVGGGGLIPPTLALVADAWPPARRGLPLGIVGAVQELGSVLGPLYGAVVLAFGDWRDIFWLNCAVGLVIAAAMSRLGDQDMSTTRQRARIDWIGLALFAVAFVALTLVLMQPDSLTTGVTSGRAFLPILGDSRWLTPMAVTAAAFFVAFVARQALAQSPLLAWRSWGATARQTDLLGAGLLALTLGAIIVAFASAEPENGALSTQAPWLIPLAFVAFGAFIYRQRTAANPLVPRHALAARPAWGALLVSFFIGAALIAALVDIPLFARLTVYRDSQLDAALVLVRFLIALPVGAVLGGCLSRWVSPRLLTPLAMALSAVAFAHMATWDRYALNDSFETISLVVAGLGFGLAIAPVNASLLEFTADAVHGIASALLVVARMIGMLIGISALTTIGLHAFYAASDRIAPVQDLCNGSDTACQAYRDALLDAGISQLHAVFIGAAVCAAIAGVLAAFLLPSRDTVRP
ncbi:MFS transporter [soil metagenome]